MKEGWEVAFWDEQERPLLVLITPAIFEALPRGTVLYSISGERVVKGKDDIDRDTRAGFMAWGFHLEHERDALGRGYEHNDPHAVVQMPGMDGRWEVP